MYKERGVVLFPTNEKAVIHVTYGVMKDSSTYEKLNPKYISDKITIPYHLYITSDDAIKGGDWYYDDWTKTISKTNIDIKKCSDYFKIIAATDKSLEIVSKGINPVYEKLPEPSLKWLNYFIDQYDKGSIITKVMVDYEENYNEEWDDLTDDTNQNTHTVKSIILKLNPDNTINIKSIKNKYSKEELLEFVMWYSGMDRNKIEKQFDKYQEGYR